MKGSDLVDRYQASPNHEARTSDISLLILHYTGMETGQRAADWLCDPVSKVSCHYLIDSDGSIVQMVAEDRRAWHAGVSQWHGVIDINSASIGIEIQNMGHGGGCPPFPPEQMNKVVALSLDIMVRYNMAPSQVLAHSDVAPGRKIDPGEAFDWNLLAQRGIGQIVLATGRSVVSEDLVNAQKALVRLGYGLEVSGQLDDRTRIVVEAFQRRYRRNHVNGKLDPETLEILQRLSAIA